MWVYLLNMAVSEVPTFTQLSTLRKRPFFTSVEARDAGVHPSLLSYYVEKNLLERVGRGVYRDPKVDSGVDFQWEDLVYAAVSVPDSVICLISALSYYEMTEEIPRVHWLAIPHTATPPKRALLKIVRMRKIDLGAERIQIGKINVRIFDREKTVVDAFRYLSRETSIKALRAYVDPKKGWKPDLQKLAFYARELRVPMDPYILAVTT